MQRIEKIIFKNFKRFKSITINCNSNLNVYIGDNEAGKSTILEAISIVLMARRRKVDILDLEKLFNVDVITEFLKNSKRYEDLPELAIELFLSEQQIEELSGKNNSELRECEGLSFICRPDDELGVEIKKVLSYPEPIFPFEFYKVEYNTFKGVPYTGYKKYLKHIEIDHAQIGSDYALKEYIKQMYNNLLMENEKLKHLSEYRKTKNIFTNEVLSEINQRMSTYLFEIKNDSKSNVETDLTIVENHIDITNKGKGVQCFIKTDLALSNCKGNLDIILLEEPENHLGHTKLNELINKIGQSSNTQIFVTTHCNMILARLDLRNAIMLNSNSTIPVYLSSLNASTSKFFMKSPNPSILNYVLSKKVILVEGDAEYILSAQFFKNISGVEISAHNIHVLSVGGTSFKRFCELGGLLKIKTAIIRDNDGDFQKNCVLNYEGYLNENIKIFCETDNTQYTFELCVYNKNREICDELFLASRKTLSVSDYMLKNKADVAFELLEKKGDELLVPKYIEDAIRWLISE